MDLLIIVIASLIFVPLTIFTSGPARMTFGLLFVLFFPGYTLMAAFFPRRTDLGAITRLALSLGISIAIVAIIFIILNSTPWGIRLNPTLISLGFFIEIMAVVAWLRRRGLHPGESFMPPFSLSRLNFFRPWFAQKGAEKVLTVLLAAAVIGVAGSLSHAIAKPGVSEEFTEFYILGISGKAEDFPAELALGEEGELILGIVNREQEPRAYSLEIAVNGEKVNEIDSINLPQEGIWEQAVTFKPTRAGPHQKVEFLLYRENHQLYRTLHFWLDVKGEVT